MKILAISNLHGRYDELGALFKKITDKGEQIESFERIIFLGDNIGFGKKTKQTISTLMKMKQKYKNMVFLKGNWEDAFYKVHRSKDREEQKKFFKFFYQHKQKQLLDELREDKQFLHDYLKFIEEMPVYHIEGNYVFTHAGVDIERWKNGMNLEDFLTKHHKEEELIWSIYFHKPIVAYWANKILNKKAPYDHFPYQLVFSAIPIHQILDEPKETQYNEAFHLGNYYSLDFGAMYEKGKIGAVVLSDEEVKTYTANVGETIYQSIQRPTKQPMGEKEQIYEWYQQGKSITEIAKIKNLKQILVIDYLLECFREGRDLDIQSFYQEEHEQMILEKAKNLKTGTLYDLKKELPEEVSIAEIKAVAIKNKLV